MWEVGGAEVGGVVWCGGERCGVCGVEVEVGVVMWRWEVGGVEVGGVEVGGVEV